MFRKNFQLNTLWTRVKFDEVSSGAINAVQNPVDDQKLVRLLFDFLDDGILK